MIDSSGNSNATDSGTADIVGQVGRARDFDGVADYIGITQVNKQSDFSVESIIKPTSISIPDQRLFFNPTVSVTTPAHDLFMMYLVNGNLNFYDGLATTGTLRTVTAGAWQHVAMRVGVAGGGMSNYNALV